MAPAFLEPTFLRSPHELKYLMSTYSVEAGDTGGRPLVSALGNHGVAEEVGTPAGHCEGCDAREINKAERLGARWADSVPGGKTAQGKRHQRGRGLEEWPPVGCSLGEILFYAEGSQREHRGLRELPAGLNSVSRAESGGGTGRCRQRLQGRRGGWMSPGRC